MYEGQGVNRRPGLAYGGTAGLRRRPASGMLGGGREQAVSELGEDRAVGTGPSADEAGETRAPVSFSESEAFDLAEE